MDSDIPPWLFWLLHSKGRCAEAVAFHIFRLVSFRQAISWRGAFHIFYEIETHPLSVISCLAVRDGGRGMHRGYLKENKSNHHFNKTILIDKYICFIAQMADRLCWLSIGLKYQSRGRPG